MVALKNDKEIGDKINKLVARLADANDTLKGAINVADFNDEEKLGKGKGKGKGQFYTPAEVSRVMAQVIELGRVTDARQSIFDPTCGSGSLLLKAHDEAKSRTGLDLALYG
jgi:type I restriction enzyme M protein